jgi:hypothetical protein
MPHQPPLTLSREDLYELVWSKPMVELAADLGLSDVALAKRCGKLGVPVPGRGYWARVAAGQEPHRPTLPKRDREITDHAALAFAPLEQEPPVTAPPDLAPEEAAMRAQIDAVVVPPLPGLGAACPAIQRLAHRDRVIPPKDICWARRADRHGPILEIHVSDAQAVRALMLADAVLRAAASLGWPFEAIKPKDTDYRLRTAEPADPLPLGAITVAGEPIAIRLDEPQRRVPHVPTAAETRRRQRGESVWAPPWDHDWSGRLCLHAHEPPSRYPDRIWHDGKRRRLEDQIPVILHGLLDLALRIKARRAQHEQWERERREQERLERERSIRREAELKRIHELERQAEAWFRARLLQRYIRAARRALGADQVTAQRGDAQVDFFAWAQGYVEQLDPLHPAARNEDLLEERIAWHADLELQKGFARLAGFDGQTAWKIRGAVNDGAADGEVDISGETYQE